MALEQPAVSAADATALPGLLYDGGAFTPLLGAPDAPVRVAFGQVAGQGVYTVCQTGEALRAQDTETCVKALRLAAKTGNPLVTFYNSAGARLDEGLAPLAAARELAAATAELSGVVPQIAVVCGVCGASGALAAIGADLLIMTKDAELFLTPPFLSADDAQPAAGGVQAAVDAGVAALTAEDIGDAARLAARLLGLLPQNNIAATAGFEYLPPTAAPDLKKYSAENSIAALADGDSALEVYKGFGGGIATVFATLAGNVVGIVATNGPESNLCRKCTGKAARFVRLCDSFSIPVVTLLNSGGFAPSVSADVAGTLREAGRLAATYADATTAKLAVVTGKAVGPLYTALGSADLTIALEGCVIAPLEPTAAVTILYKEEIETAEGSIEAETKARAAAYATKVAGAGAALEAGLADIVCEPAQLRERAAGALEMLLSKRTQRLPKKHGNMPL